MADKQIVKAKRSGGKASIDAGMAALAALSVGFIGYAMPASVFLGLVGATGLAVAADPDSTARYTVVAAAATLTFVLIYALLRALGRLPSRPSKSAEMAAEPPRLRRADAHPDAPSRWPLFARHELGDPIPAEQLDGEDTEQFAEGDRDEAQALDEPVSEWAVEDGSEQPLPGLLAGGLEISDGEPVEREPAEHAELDHPLPSFIPSSAAEDEASEAHPEQPEVEEDIAAPIAEIQPTEDFVTSSLFRPRVKLTEAAPVIEPIDEPAEEAPVVEIAEAAAPLAETLPDSEDIASEPALTEEEAFAPLEETVAEFDETTVAQIEPQPASVVEAEPAIVAETDVAPPIAEQVTAVDEMGEPLLLDEPAPVEEEFDGAEDHPPVEATGLDEPIETLAARIPQLPEPRDESVSELMGRLEVGLGRRDRAAWLGAPEPVTAEAAPASDDRLRSALGMLRKMKRKG